MHLRCTTICKLCFLLLVKVSNMLQYLWSSQTYGRGMNILHYKKMPNGHHMNQRNISKLIGLRSHMIQDNKNFIKNTRKEEQEVYHTYLMKQTMNNLILWTIQKYFLNLTRSCMHATVEYTCTMKNIIGFQVQ